MTSTVLTTVITTTGSQIGFKMPQVSSSPTAAGINITGMMSMRNLPASRTEDSFTIPVHRASSISSRP